MIFLLPGEGDPRGLPPSQPARRGAQSRGAQSNAWSWLCSSSPPPTPPPSGDLPASQGCQGLRGDKVVVHLEKEGVAFRYYWCLSLRDTSPGGCMLQTALAHTCQLQLMPHTGSQPPWIAPCKPRDLPTSIPVSCREQLSRGPCVCSIGLFHVNPNFLSSPICPQVWCCCPRAPGQDSCPLSLQPPGAARFPTP